MTHKEDSSCKPLNALPSTWEMRLLSRTLKFREESMEIDWMAECIFPWINNYINESNYCRKMDFALSLVIKINSDAYDSCILPWHKARSYCGHWCAGKSGLVMMTNVSWHFLTNVYVFIQVENSVQITTISRKDRLLWRLAQVSGYVYKLQGIRVTSVATQIMIKIYNFQLQRKISCSDLHILRK